VPRYTYAFPSYFEDSMLLMLTLSTRLRVRMVAAVTLGGDFQPGRLFC